MNHSEKNATLPFENLSNFRDVGGWKTEEGYFMKTGVLFRSGELSKMDQSLLEPLNIKLICDLRTQNELNKKPPPQWLSQGIRVRNIPLHAQETHDISRMQLMKYFFSKSGGADFEEFRRNYYHHLAFDRTAQVKEVITAISHEENLPAVIHCTAGRDRTGYISALIQLLVGIPYEIVLREYLLTNHFYASPMEKMIKILRWITLFQVPPERMKMIFMAKQADLDEIYENMIRKYGSVEDYLCEACEMERKTIIKLKNMLLE